MLQRLLDRMLVVTVVVAGGLVVYLAVTLDFEIVMRYFFNRPTTWVIDFSEYALLYITFLGAAWVLSKEGHVKIDLLLNALSPRNQQVLNTITSLLGAGACAVFLWLSLWVSWEAFEAGHIFWRATIIPKWPILIVMPIGSLFLTIQFLRRAWLYARGRRAYEGNDN